MLAAALTVAVAAASTRDIDGQQYPLELAGGKQVLVGGGTRYKYGMIKVYAVALYVSRATSDKWAVDHRGKSAATLAADASFYESIIKSRSSKSLLLQFHRAVDSGTVAGALKDALTSRLDEPVVKAFHEALERALGGGKVKQGAQIYFTCSDSKVTIGVGSPSAAAVVNEGTVCPALLDVYYGKEPISPSAKDGVAAGVALLPEPKPKAEPKAEPPKAEPKEEM